MSQLAIQIRNNSSVIYWKDEEKDKGGYTSTLRQNLKTKYDDVLKELNNTKEEINLKEWYSKYIDVYTKKAEEIARQKEVELKDIRVTGRASKRTLKRVIENLVNIVYENYKPELKTENAYLVFLTLSLPSTQIHTDKVIKRQLALFIERLQIEHNVKNYVWRAESQKNGNIHFHLLVDRFLNKDKVNDLWNNIINRLGYVDRYGKENPPSTNIHSMGRKPDDVIKYVTKYLTKIPDDNYRGIIGRVWGCKRGLTKFQYFELDGHKAKRVIQYIEENHKDDKIELLVPYVEIYKIGMNQLKNVFDDVYNDFRKRLKKLYYLMYKSLSLDFETGEITHGY